MTEYFGDTPILPHMAQAWNNQNESNFTTRSVMGGYLLKDHKDGKISKMNHYIWAKYASSVDDIRIDNVLPFRDLPKEKMMKTRTSAAIRCY